MRTQILLRLLLFSHLPNVSQVRPWLASKIRCDQACNNVKKNKPWKALWIIMYIFFPWHAKKNKMEVLSQLCFLLGAPTLPYYCEQRFLKIKAHWFVCYFRLCEAGRAGNPVQIYASSPIKGLQRYLNLHPLHTRALCAEGSWHCPALSIPCGCVCLCSPEPLCSCGLSHRDRCQWLAALASCPPRTLLGHYFDVWWQGSGASLPLCHPGWQPWLGGLTCALPAQERGKEGEQGRAPWGHRALLQGLQGVF